MDTDITKATDFPFVAPSLTDDTRASPGDREVDPQEPLARAAFYQARYPYDGVPISDSSGLLDDLFRVRPVLNGVLYRGGVLRKQASKQDGDRPLGPDALINLCEEGFGTAIYLPGEGFYTEKTVFPHDARLAVDPETGDVLARCLTRVSAQENVLRYTQLPVENDDNIPSLMDMVYKALQPGGQPIFAHCRGGRHRAGLMATYSLIQYCGLSNDPHTDEKGNVLQDTFGGILSDASEYWYRNTGGKPDDPRDPTNPDYDPTDSEWIREFTETMNMIGSFIPLPGLTISPELQQAVCPPAKDPVDPKNEDHF